MATQSSTPADVDLNEFGSLGWHGGGSADLANDGDIDGFFNNGSVSINNGRRIMVGGKLIWGRPRALGAFRPGFEP